MQTINWFALGIVGMISTAGPHYTNCQRRGRLRFRASNRMLRYTGAVIDATIDTTQKPLSFCRSPEMGRGCVTDGRASRAFCCLDVSGRTSWLKVVQCLDSGHTAQKTGHRAPGALPCSLSARDLQMVLSVAGERSQCRIESLPHGCPGLRMGGGMTEAQESERVTPCAIYGQMIPDVSIVKIN
jgi:hypothetical protein